MSMSKDKILNIYIILNKIFTIDCNTCSCHNLESVILFNIRIIYIIKYNSILISNSDFVYLKKKIKLMKRKLYIVSCIINNSDIPFKINI